MECPYLEADIPDCAEVLNMEHLATVFDLCVNRYMNCPVYQRLSQATGRQAEAQLNADPQRREICRV